MKYFALLFASIAIGLLPASAEIPVTAGLHQKVEVDKVKPPCHLYLPEGFDLKPARPYPVLILQNPSGRTAKDIARYTDWADREQVVLVGINGPKNGMPDHLKPAIQDRTLNGLSEALPLHPFLRFTTGMSGGSADGWRMVRRQTQRFAGVVFQGVTGGIRDKHQNLIVVIHAGAKDEWGVRGVYDKMLPKMQELGMRYWLDVGVDRGHDWAPMDEQQRALSWMVNQARLSDPRLSDDERIQNREWIQTRVEAAIEFSDLEAIEALLRLDDLPSTERLARMWVILKSRWLGTLPPNQQALALHDWLASPQIKAVSETTKRGLQERMQRMLQYPAVAAYVNETLRFREIEDMEKQAGLSPERLIPVRDAWKEFLSHASDTQAEATKRLGVVEKLIADPKKQIGQ